MNLYTETATGRAEPLAAAETAAPVSQQAVSVSDADLDLMAALLNVRLGESLTREKSVWEQSL